MFDLSADWVLASDESIDQDTIARLARSQDMSVRTQLVMNSAVPKAIIWELAVDPSLRAAATNNSNCPLPILLGQRFISVPMYQIERVLLAVYPSSAVPNGLLECISLEHDSAANDQLSLAEALNSISGVVDFTAFSM